MSGDHGTEGDNSKIQSLFAAYKMLTQLIWVKTYR